MNHKLLVLIIFIFLKNNRYLIHEQFQNYGMQTYIEIGQNLRAIKIYKIDR